MNKLHLLAAACLLSGCTYAGIEGPVATKVYTAGFESVPTRSYLDSGMKAHWNEKDEISVFNTTHNDRYVFDGQTGDTSGEFHAAESPGSGSPGLHLCRISLFNCNIHIARRRNQPQHSGPTAVLPGQLRSRDQLYVRNLRQEFNRLVFPESVRIRRAVSLRGCRNKFD